ncbi:DUF2721 domain-containing protein [Taibaiella lutea]|uniref:hypothetical protein n=1 Tax=Taibaiella lutea TaxID=2608001 RepID=UPI00167FE248|nr:hypothetical protein [Taibaiella lutea]
MDKLTLEQRLEQLWQMYAEQEEELGALQQQQDRLKERMRLIKMAIEVLKEEIQG